MSKFGRNPVTDLFPGNGFCFAGIEVRDAAGDFFVPGGFDGFGIVMSAIQTLQQRARQFSAFFHAKGEGALQQFSGVVRHGIIIRPESGYRPEVTAGGADIAFYVGDLCDRRPMRCLLHVALGGTLTRRIHIRPCIRHRRSQGFFSIRLRLSGQASSVKP